MNTELFASLALIERANELTRRTFPDGRPTVALIGEDVEAMALWAKTNMGVNYSYLLVPTLDAHPSVRYAVAGHTLVGVVFFEPDSIPEAGKVAARCALSTAAHLLDCLPHQLMVYPCLTEKQEPEDWTHLSYPAQHAVAALEEGECREETKQSPEEAPTPVEAHLQSYRDRGLIVTAFPITGVHTGADVLKEKWRSYMVMSPTDEGVAGTRIYCTDAIAVERDSSDARCKIVVHPDRTKVGTVYTSSIIAYILLEIDKDLQGTPNVLEEYEDGRDEEDDELEVSDFVAPKSGSLYRHVDGGYYRVRGMAPAVHDREAGDSVAVRCIWPDVEGFLLAIHPDLWVREFTAVSEQSLNYSMKRDRSVVQAMIEANRHQRETAEQERQDADAAEDPPLSAEEEEELDALPTLTIDIKASDVLQADELEVVDVPEEDAPAYHEGQLFRHTDGGYYRYLTQVLSSEDHSPQVVYEHVWPFEINTWVRPLSEWVPRFAHVTEAEVNAAMTRIQEEYQRVIRSNKAARQRAAQLVAALDGDAKTAEEEDESVVDGVLPFLCHLDHRSVYSGSILFDAEGTVWEAVCLDSSNLARLHLRRLNAHGLTANRLAYPVSPNTNAQLLFWYPPAPTVDVQEGGAPLAYIEGRLVYPGAVVFDTSGKQWRVRCLDNNSMRLHMQSVDVRGLADNYLAAPIDPDGKPCLFWESPVLPMTAHNPEAAWKK